MPKATLYRFARISLFLVYFWFGILKVLGLSPATQLVNDLFNATLAGVMSFAIFFPLFGLFEVLIGISFLFPKLIKISTIGFAAHIITTAMPLVLLPNQAWQAFFVPTLEGQYILKNIVLIALVFILFFDAKKSEK